MAEISDRRFPRSVRLLGAGDFKQVFSGSKRSADAYFTVLARPRQVSGSSTDARLGLTISKRQIQRAVDRNRLKRLARETFRSIRAALPPLDFVVMAKKSACAADNASLSRSLTQHLERLGRRNRRETG